MWCLIVTVMWGLRVPETMIPDYWCDWSLPRHKTQSSELELRSVEFTSSYVSQLWNLSMYALLSSVWFWASYFISFITVSLLVKGNKENVHILVLFSWVNEMMILKIKTSLCTTELFITTNIVCCKSSITLSHPGWVTNDMADAIDNVVTDAWQVTTDVQYKAMFVDRLTVRITPETQAELSCMSATQTFTWLKCKLQHSSAVWSLLDLTFSP